MTDAFSPWISDTTAMIDVTATMLPSTVMNDRSLVAQIALRARSPADFEELVHVAVATAMSRLRACVAASTFTASPSRHAAHRVERTGDRPGRRPSGRDSTSKYLSPAMPILTGTNSALPSRTTNTPSVSLRVCPGLSSAAARVGSTGAARPLVGRAARFDDLPVGVVDQLADGTAGIGTDSDVPCASRS